MVEQVIEAILGEEEPPRLHAIAGDAVGQGADIAAGAETPIAGMIDDHRLDRAVPPPGEQRGDHRLAHRGGEGPKGIAAIQRQAPYRPFDADDDFGTAHRRNISRAMITRMISFVPSRIWCTRRSRTIRSRG